MDTCLRRYDDTNLVADYRSPRNVSIGTTDVIPAQAGIQYICGLVLHSLLDSSFRWNDNVCDALRCCIDFVITNRNGVATRLGTREKEGAGCSVNYSTCRVKRSVK